MFILALSLVWIERTFGQARNCPSKCRCIGLSVDCHSQSLIESPHDLPEWTESLNLSYNEILFMPDISNTPNLASIDLSANNITTVRDGLNYSQLHSLNLCHNSLTAVPSHIFHNRTLLRHLQLSNNHIETLETSTFANFSHLITLKLNKNRISHIPKYAFKNLTNLAVLDLSRNKLQQLEGLTFEGLRSLHLLNLRSNELVHLSDGTFWGLDRIEKLLLDNNQISSISGKWLYGLNTLKHLSLRQNLVQEIRGGWEFCKKLVSLDLRNNHLTVLTKANFHHLGTLKKLLLDYNYINVIEDKAFNDLGSLNSLEMSNNMIPWDFETAEGPFHTMGKLKRLVLSYNSIRFISKRVFEGLGRLRSLDLSANPISSIQEGAFSHFARPLYDFKLNTSSLLCDCSLRWFHDWLTRSNFTTTFARCLYPPWFQDIPFLQTDPQNFTCDNIPKPIIQSSPPPQILALKGGNLTLSCEATSSSEPSTFHWRKDGKILVGNRETNTKAFVAEVGTTRFTSHLSLRNITDGDEGWYQCVISNEFGSIYSPLSHITVNVYPYFTKVPAERVEVRAGGTARLVCAAKGQPPPEVSWRKDGGDDFPAARERRMHVMPSDDVFFIVGVQAADAGLYSCMATNAAGTAAANVTLTVSDVPSILFPLVDQEVETGESVSLDCRYTNSGSAPISHVHWFKDNSPLVPKEDHHFFTAQGLILLLVQTTVADTGRYACRLGPELTIASCYLTVLPPGNAPGKGNRTSDNNKLIVGIVAIAIVCCIVVTSLIWVIIIYKTRGKNALPAGGLPKVQTLPRPQPPNYHDLPPSSALIEESSYLCGIDSHSDDSSKCDSGNGGEQEAFFPTPTTKIKHQSLILLASNKLKSSAGSSSLGGSLGSLPSCTGGGKDDNLHWTWVRSMSSHHLPPEEVHFLKLPPDSQADSGSFSIESGKLYNVHHPCT